MLTARENALEKVLEHYKNKPKGEAYQPSERFGSKVFSRSVMQCMLPKKIYENVMETIECEGKIDPAYADTIAFAMKEWAMSHGAVHYCHWFQPLTGLTAEKHDSFLDWKGADTVIEKFCGQELIRGEPDASSFPNGGLRNTYEARGYTSWDPTAPAFLWKVGGSVTLCIPSVFFSWTGDVLDTKIPLMRSDREINHEVIRLLKLTGISAKTVFSTLGCEQEYFVVDRALTHLRPDLMTLGKTVYGAQPPKGQELSDHYFGAVKERVLSFMHDFEQAAIDLAIPVKTRHNEVAPAQHEIAVHHEKASRSVDHNIMLMELMRKKAHKHNLTCLLHEKPFDGLNGSGKHHNWSLCTDTGLNLLDPSDTPENNLHFIVLLATVLKAVHKHAGLLRACIGSHGNDSRLGGHEAPPAIISVYLGEALESLLNDIEKGGSHKSAAIQKISVGLSAIPEMPKHNTDRNRTSPFAFTGNKFEFRAVGSTMSPAFPITVINSIVASELRSIVDALEPVLAGAVSREEKLKAIVPVIRKVLKESKGIRFGGDNYSGAWEKEAQKRGLPNTKRSLPAFAALKTEETVQAFTGVLTEEELSSRYEVMVDTYTKELNIELNLMIELFRTHILPAAFRYQTEISNAFVTGMPSQEKYLLKVARAIDEAIATVDALEEARAMPVLEGDNLELLIAKREEARQSVDALEGLVDDKSWPLPKYREMLFIL